jgi:hypothetical protein
MDGIDTRYPVPALGSATEHDRAVRAIEARQIARALKPFGLLDRGALKEATGAVRWHEGTFAGALAAAVAMGLIERCPMGFYRYRWDGAPSQDQSAS